MHRNSDSVRMRKRDGGWSRRIAVVLLLAAIGVAAWLYQRDTDWEERSRDHRSRGVAAMNNNQYLEARVHFEAALAANPFDWTAHQLLARVFGNFLHDNSGALRHYLYALAYAPESTDVKEMTDQVDVLYLIRAGFLESPADAIEDMFLAVEAGAKSAFFSRLSPRLRGDFAAYWDGWSRRGRGVVTYQRVWKEQSGLYDARVSVAFPDQTALSMHLLCSARDTWRLDVAFP